MFKLAFLFVVLMVVVVTSTPHPRQNHSKKVSASTKHRSVAHHGLESHHEKLSAAKRVVRSHGGGAHTPVHHPQSKATHHAKKFAGKRIARGIHGRSHEHGHGHSDNKAALVRPVKKNRGHRK